MTKDDLKYLDVKFNAIDKQFSSQKELYEVKATHIMAETRILVEDTNERLDEIVKQNKIRNHRIEGVENSLIVAKKDLNFISTNCSRVQDKKDKDKKDRKDNLKWAAGTLIACLMLVIATYKIFPQKVVVNKEIVIFEKINDTLVRIAPINMRKAGGYKIDTVNSLLLNINNLKEF